MLPLQDNILSFKYPFVNTSLIVVNVIAFFYEITQPNLNQFVLDHGLVASNLIHHFDLTQLATAFTSMFMHSNGAHIFSNLWFLYIFGDNVEDKLGHWKYLLFYLLCGLAAGVTHVLVQPQMTVPCIGASGAIAGVLAGYLVLYPKARVQTQVIFWYPMLSAWLIISGWFILNCLSAYFQLDDSIAWYAHIGGFIAGAVLILLLTSRKRSADSNESAKIRELPAMSWIACTLLVIILGACDYAATSVSNSLIQKAQMKIKPAATQTTKTKNKSTTTTATKVAQPQSKQNKKHRTHHQSQNPKRQSQTSAK